MLTIEEPIKQQILKRFGWIFGGGPEGAREVLSSIASSMITVTGVVFSVTIVALTLASQQFGPRLLRHFIRDRGNQAVLGIFISTFLYSLLVLRTVRGTEDSTYVPHISVTIGVIFAVVSVVFLIYFIHHVARLIQAPQIVAAVAGELNRSIKKAFPEMHQEAARENSEGIVFEIPEGFDTESRPVRCLQNGYVQAINEEHLIGTARQQTLLVRLRVRPSDFVIRDSYLAEVWPGASLDEQLEEEIRRAFIVGAQRTPTQDPVFLFDELTEVAVRSLSPSINDPFTAINCIDHLSAALVELGNRQPISPYKYDAGGDLRIITQVLTFEGVANKVFSHIRQYAASNAQIAKHLLEVIRTITLHVKDKDYRKAVFRQATMIRHSCNELMEENDRMDVETRFQALTEVLDRDEA